MAEGGGRSRKIVIPEVSYIGALPETDPCSSGVLEVTDERVAVIAGRRIDPVLGTSFPSEFVLPADGIVAVTVEGPEQVQRRVTVTRLVLVGIFAFGWKKKERLSYLVVENADGMAVFECRSLTPLELRARLASWLARFADLTTVEPQATDGAAERLRRVTALHAEGLLSDSEFEAKRVEIIADL